MKKVILSLAIVALTATAANAQTGTGKGTWLLGGSAGFASSKESGSESTTYFSIAPRAGYFVADDIAVGAGVGFTSVKDSYSAFEFAPFVRYYFLPLGPKAKLFGHGSFGFGSYKPNGGSSSSSTNWELSAGPAFFLNPSIALEIALGYSSTKPKDFDATNTFGVNVGFQIHFNKGSK